MKVIKPFFLGMLGGLGLALVLLVGLFFSPLRQGLYFSADPEMMDIRSKLGQYQEWLAQTDLRIAENPSLSDSLQNAQTKAWRDYKGWRNRLGELARAHAHPTAEGFWPWTYSLRFWILPIAAGLAFLPALFLAWSARSRFRPGRGKPPGKTARAQALSHFEDAVKKVARIAESAPSERKVPDTVPMALIPDPPKPADPGSETHFIQAGPGWGESLAAPDERIGNPGPVRPAGLSMEDEDAAQAHGVDGEGEGEESMGMMPPTTEVERVERRKEEVLKLARKGMTSSEISRRMRISQDQVEFIIRLRREKG